MAGYSFEQQQHTSQLQVQRFSQAQIQTLNLLAMGSQDLRAEIYKAVEENPVLEIKKDAMIDEIRMAKKTRSLTSDTTRLSASSIHGEEKSKAYQQMIEAKADERETLREHLIFQLDVMELTQLEHDIGVKLIDNLDERGMHILAPASLISDLPLADDKLLSKMIATIQHFDPIGTCCSSIEESLFVQAKIIGNAPLLALFLLDGHLDMIDSSNIQRIQKKLDAFKKEQSKLVLANSNQMHRNDDVYYKLFSEDISQEKIDEALIFIRSLNPRPAGQFVSGEIHYVRPDVYITKKEGHIENDDVHKGVIKFDEDSYYEIRLENDAVPEVGIAKDFKVFANISDVKNRATNKTAHNAKDVLADGHVSDELAQAIEKARSFIKSISYRTDTIKLVCCELVKIQNEFFEKGTGHLVPLTRREIAERVGVHESTVSRMADSKYIQCAWGLFAIKYFFTSGVARASNKDESDKDNIVSRDAVLAAMKKILDVHEAGEKKLSDQKLADMLAEHGIKIARRTVAKYRALLDIGSSYER